MHVSVNLLPSKENPTNMSYCEFWQELKNTFFIQHFRETASVHYPKTSQELYRATGMTHKLKGPNMEEFYKSFLLNCECTV